MYEDPTMRYSTYSIVARDASSGQYGVAVQTHQMCVGVGVPWLAAGSGAIVTQAMTNVRFGPMGLSLLDQGLAAKKVLAALIATDENADSRQLAVVDHRGRVAAWTGEDCIPIADHKLGDGYSVQANMMLKTGVVEAMAHAFEASESDFAGRLLTALKAAQDAGGDIRGMQSAAIKIVQNESHDHDGLRYILPQYDLRVDEHEEPLKELERLVRMRRALLRSRQGFELMDAGDQEAAMKCWVEARDMAPEMEELVFWQAVSLADDGKDFHQAAAILKPVLSQQRNRADWIDLLYRIEACGIIEAEGTAERLIQELGAQDGPASTSS